MYEGNKSNTHHIFFFLNLLKEVESSLRTNRDSLASLKSRTPCQNRHDYRLNHPQGRQDQKNTSKGKEPISPKTPMLS